jgi:WD40 repeat protein
MKQVSVAVRVWSIYAGLIHTFHGHSRPITHIIRHPDSTALFITSSLDGSVKLWSLDTMDCLYRYMDTSTVISLLTGLYTKGSPLAETIKSSFRVTRFIWQLGQQILLFL